MTTQSLLEVLAGEVAAAPMFSARLGEALARLSRATAEELRRHERHHGFSAAATEINAAAEADRAAEEARYGCTAAAATF